MTSGLQQVRQSTGLTLFSANVLVSEVLLVCAISVLYLLGLLALWNWVGCAAVEGAR